MPHIPLFPTPVSMYELPGMDEINRDLTARLVAESVSVPSVRHSNIGGWHSKTDLHMRSEACFRTLIQHIVTRVRETAENLAQESGQQLPVMHCKTHAWAMVMRNGDYTIPHDHIGRRCTTPTRGTRTKRRILIPGCSGSSIRGTGGGRSLGLISSAGPSMLSRGRGGWRFFRGGCSIT